MIASPDRQSRLRGGLLGLLVGDALGVPYEFKSPEELPPSAAIDFVPPEGFPRSHRGVPTGTWSDDGAQALCLLASLLEKGRFDADDFAECLVAWYDNGYLAVDGIVFDVGMTTTRAISALKHRIPALTAGPSEDYDNGNGSLMRVLPLALWHQGSDAELVEIARDQSRVTHGHPRSQLCCALYSLWARRILQQETNPWESAAATARELLGSDAVFAAELDLCIRAGAKPGGSGTGYVLDTLHSARRAVLEPNYEQTVRFAVCLGQDTDTTACVAGGIAGLIHGEEAIPIRWRDALRGRDLLDPLLEALSSSGG